MIKIYTYADPYHINEESFWHEIKDCPQFCVSQTMVNGMEETYRCFKERDQLTTIRILINALYHEWEALNTRVRQITEVDATLMEMAEDEHIEENIQRSLSYNTSALADSIRMFQELGMGHLPFSTRDLNLDQLYLIKLYERVLRRGGAAFSFSRVWNEGEIDAAIEAALKKKHGDVDMSQLDTRTVVIHGIHQFTPSMLCAIEDISRYKTVILIFNYQSQYQAIYRTWLNIYELFGLQICTETADQFRPIRMMVDSYKANMLADRMGKLADGQYLEADTHEPIEVIEFANMTEFAGYAASLFEDARREWEKNGKRALVLSYMKEQLYAASGRVNDILRAYFPEQFGERHFLDYPIGHFFVSTTSMWDPDQRCVKVDRMSDVKECLECGIIAEERPGQHINSLEQVMPYIEKEVTLKDMIDRLKQLKKYVSSGDEMLKHVGYMTITKEDLSALIQAMTELEQIVRYFFVDFEAGGDNFRRFYQRIQDFISKRISDMENLDKEMRVVIYKLLERLKTSDLPENGTFIGLRQTMSYYLSQDEALVKGANWIVRDFEQIDGDILRSDHQDADRICYHFCCLSDKDICAAREERLPWPLDIHFFEVACEPLDWKYQIFLKSKMEFRNFKRYALLYGLEFDRIGVKLSYVKSENDKENDLFHLLSMLGAKVRPYREYRDASPLPKLGFEDDRIPQTPHFTREDCIKWAMCPYRFALETLVQQQTVFRDRFLILNYIKTLLINRVRKGLQGKKYSISVLQQALEHNYDELSYRFRILNELEKTQLIYESYREIKREAGNKNWRTFPMINPVYKQGMETREIFLKVITDGTIGNMRGESLNEAELVKRLEEEKEYSATPMVGFCTMCASKDICLKRIKEKS